MEQKRGLANRTTLLHNVMQLIQSMQFQIRVQRKKDVSDLLWRLGRRGETSHFVVFTLKQALGKKQAQKRHSGLKACSVLHDPWRHTLTSYMTSSTWSSRDVERGKEGKKLWFKLPRPQHTTVEHTAVDTCSEDNEKFMISVKKITENHCKF